MKTRLDLSWGNVLIYLGGKAKVWGRGQLPTPLPQRNTAPVCQSYAWNIIGSIFPDIVYTTYAVDAHTFGKINICEQSWQRSVAYIVHGLVSPIEKKLNYVLKQNAWIALSPRQQCTCCACRIDLSDRSVGETDRTDVDKTILASQHDCCAGVCKEFSTPCLTLCHWEQLLCVIANLRRVYKSFLHC